MTSRRTLTIAIILTISTVCGVAYFYEFSITVNPRGISFPESINSDLPKVFPGKSLATATAVSSAQPPLTTQAYLNTPPVTDVTTQYPLISTTSNDKASNLPASSGKGATSREHSQTHEHESTSQRAQAREHDQNNNSGVKYDLLIIIPVKAEERSRRDAIRKSWMLYPKNSCCRSCHNHKVHTVFIVGNEGDAVASRAEAKETGDLHVLEDFGQNQYYTLRSQKTAYSVRDAVKHYNFRFLLKTDSDSWVFIDRLLDLFDQQKLWDNDRLYAGNFQIGAGAKARQDKKDKWFDPIYTKVTDLTTYPKHAKGAGYILSRSLAEYVATVDVSKFEFLPSEDVSMGFWLSSIKRETVEIPVLISADCGSAAKGPVIDHYINAEKMRERWLRYEEFGDPCSTKHIGETAKSKCRATK